MAQTFIGVKALNNQRQLEDTNQICFDKVLDFVRKGHQVMVFVHARNATVNTGMKLLELAQNQGATESFLPEDSSQYVLNKKMILKTVKIFCILQVRFSSKSNEQITKQATGRIIQRRFRLPSRWNVEI